MLNIFSILVTTAFNDFRLCPPVKYDVSDKVNFYRIFKLCPEMDVVDGGTTEAQTKTKGDHILSHNQSEVDFAWSQHPASRERAMDQEREWTESKGAVGDSSWSGEHRSAGCIWF